jgi:hypothetical protein
MPAPALKTAGFESSGQTGNPQFTRDMSDQRPIVCTLVRPKKIQRCALGIDSAPDIRVWDSGHTRYDA